MRNFLIVFIVCLFLPLQGSTIGIATGSQTSDGRPLLFKNKDRTDDYPPDIAYYQGDPGEHDYVYQKRYNQDHTRVRMGVNSAGFGIVYSDSENLSGAGTGPSGSQLSAIALKTCATLDDFRALLVSTNGARDVHNHFGVIDSTGSGSLFEVDGFSYFELPVIDSIATMANTAKFHTSAGPPVAGSTSPDREARAGYLLTHGPPGGLDYAYFVQDITHDYAHTQADEDNMPMGQYLTNPVLSRYKTSIGGVVRGCKPGDDPLIESVMWLALGEPALSIALPFLPNAGAIFDFVRYYSTGEGMPGSTDQVRSYVYDYTDGRYADRSADTYMLERIRSSTFAIEDSLFSSYEGNITIWRDSAAASQMTVMRQWAYDLQLWAKTVYDAMAVTLENDQPAIITPTRFVLFSSYPNPFNPATIIRYELPHTAHAVLNIYDIQGREVVRLVDQTIESGYHQVVWQGKTADGSRVPSGIYIARLHYRDDGQARLATPEYSKSIKMVLIK